LAREHSAEADVVPARSPAPVHRRDVLAGLGGAAALAGLGLFNASCAVDDDPALKSGNLLRLGMAGGSSADSLDPRTYLDWVPINIGYQIMNGLVEVDGAGNAVPELFESWESSADAREWVFRIRGGVVFHNGKPLGVDDILYSINLHRGDTTSVAKGVVANIVDVKRLDANRVKILLAGGDADLPTTLSDYHLLVVPAGFDDWSHPIGTGGYRLDRFEPGVRSITTKAGDYWKAGAAHVDAIELLVINDAMARTNALIGGQVDIINRIDGRTADLLRRNKRLKVIRSQTGQHAIFATNCTADPYENNEIRLALKYAIDRERIVKTVLNGYGTVGNDQPISPRSPYFDADLPVHRYDPDQARYHLRRAGRDALAAELKVSDAAFSGAVDAAVLFQSAAAAAGITLAVKREPIDGYWSNVWIKAPFYVSYSDGRATLDAAFSKAYKSSSAANDTSWRNPEFDALANVARGMQDPRRRRELYGECQRMISADGGAIIPMFIDHIEAGSTHVQGWTPSALFDLMGQRIGEKVWLQS